MATWTEVNQFILNRFDNVELEDGLLKFYFTFDDGRKQLVFASDFHDDNNTTWLDISSPIGTLTPEGLDEALKYVSAETCVGISKIGEYHCVRQCFLINNITDDEIYLGLYNVSTIADVIEEHLIGDDVF